MHGVLAPETPLVCAFRAKEVLQELDRVSNHDLSPQHRRVTDQRRHVGRTLLHGKHGARCAATTGRAAQQRRSSLVRVALCIQDSCSHHTALLRPHSQCLLDIRRLGDSALVEHAKVSHPELCASFVVKRRERGVISTLLTSLGTSVGLNDS